MYEFIKQTLINIYKTCSVDRYGQVSKSTLSLGIFGDKTDEVNKYISEHKGILSLSTYGWRYGTYKAYTILDENIKKECHNALSYNQNHKDAMTGW